MPSEAIRLINLGRVPAWQTQALYHAIAESMTVDTPDAIILCQPDTPHLCLGYHQVYDAVMDRSECARLELPVYRRRLGGGATYLDSDQLFYQCVFHHSRVPAFVDRLYAQMLQAPIRTLRRLGLPAELVAVNEIVVDRRRIAGVGGGRIGEASVVVGNLLFDFDYQSMARVWRVPSAPFRRLALEAMHGHIATLQGLDERLAMGEVRRILIEEFAANLDRPLKPGAPMREEAEQALEVAERQTSTNYLQLHRPDGRVKAMDSLKIAAGVFVRAGNTRVNGHQVHGSFLVQDGTIRRAHLESTPARHWNELMDRLIGVPFGEWEGVLAA